MADRTKVQCVCGASGDQGELVEHCVSRLSDPDDNRTHGWPDESEQVTRARAVLSRRLETRQQVADQLGVSVAELREALR